MTTNALSEDLKSDSRRIVLKKERLVLQSGVVTYSHRIGSS